MCVCAYTCDLHVHVWFTQVDQHDIAVIGPQESVARIKEKTLVTLTIHRGLDSGEHLYDEIFYSDSRNNSQDQLSQQDENTPSNMITTTYPRHRGRTAARQEENQQYYNHPVPAPTPAATTTTATPAASNGGHLNVRPVHRAVQRHSSGPLEKGSKDSGLSSVGSTHQDCCEDRHAGFTGTTEPYHVRMGSQGSHCGSEHSRIEGNYEVEVRVCLYDL